MWNCRFGWLGITEGARILVFTFDDIINSSVQVFAGMEGSGPGGLMALQVGISISLSELTADRYMIFDLITQVLGETRYNLSHV